MLKHVLQNYHRWNEKSLDELCQIAEDLGYRFFAFNGLVYVCTSGGTYLRTCVQLSELN